jgi:SAM-dependent methyltransferase
VIWGKAEHPLRLFARRHIFVPPLIRYILPFIPQEGLVVDLGAGYGVVSIMLARLRPRCRFIAVDLDEERVRIARRLTSSLGNVSVLAGDMTDRDFNDVSVFLLIDSIGYLSPPEQEGLLARCRRSLLPGGYLIIKTNAHRPAWKYRFALLEERIVSGRRMFYPDSSWLTERLFEIGYSISAIHRTYRFLPYPGIIYICQASKG